MPDDVDARRRSVSEQWWRYIKPLYDDSLGHGFPLGSKQQLIESVSAWGSTRGLSILFESTIEFSCVIETSLAKEIELSKGHFPYMADLHTMLSEVQKKQHENNATKIQARTVF